MLAHCPLPVVGVNASEALASTLELCQLDGRNMSLSLREYAKRFKRSLRAIAVAADVDTGDIYAIADGKAGWTAETAARIQKATDGHVTPNDLLEVRQGFLAKEEKRARAKLRSSRQKKSLGRAAETEAA